jgi:ABC-2 type transport system permease protein
MRKSTKYLIGIFNVLLLFALVAAFINVQQHQHTVEHYGQEVRESWEKNPDKHPHRMAHYGYVAFREKYALSFFDYGMDSYLGNAVFLEAHRQNTINFSQASLSNSLVRFGEISSALILQLLLPLLIFFLGFSLIASERETGTLRLVLSQGAAWKELILGKTFGLFFITLSILIPTSILTIILLLWNKTSPEIFSGLGLLTLCYLFYLFVLSLLTTWVSATSKTSKNALIKLIACWLFFTLILPKISQVIGQVFIPSPSKIEFDTAVEHELIKQGDSHNPDDPHYKGLKDSLLVAHQVTNINELPFNYSGFIMKEGERLSTETFRKYQLELMKQYEQQQNLVKWTAIINPYIAIKNLSMAFSGTDFKAYRNFQDQAETFRYNLAQTMNDLQIKHISNNVKTSADKNAVLSQQYWIDFPDFEHRQLTLKEIMEGQWYSMLTLTLWIIGLLMLIFFNTKNLKAF